MSEFREPSLEAAISNAASNGWEFFNGPVAQDGPTKIPDDKQARLAAIAAALFNVPEFRELMEFELDQTLRRATFLSPLGLKMEEVYGQGMFREGQNSMVALRLKMIAEGRKQATPAPRQV